MGNEKSFLSKFFGRQPTEKELAGHYADRISALQRNGKTLLREGNGNLRKEVKKEIKKIREEAEDNGFGRKRFPGLFR